MAPLRFCWACFSAAKRAAARMRWTETAESVCLGTVAMHLLRSKRCNSIVARREGGFQIGCTPLEQQLAALRDHDLGRGNGLSGMALRVVGDVDQKPSNRSG